MVRGVEKQPPHPLFLYRAVANMAEPRLFLRLSGPLCAAGMAVFRA
jgi:hypothetical protein